MENKKRSRKKGKNQTNRKKKRLRWTRILGLIALLLFGVMIFAVYNAYQEIKDSTQNMHETVEFEQRRPEPVSVADGEEPFSVLLMGIDSGDMGRVEQGRSDTMMLATVNPNTGKVGIVSIPRDTYLEIPGYGMDKVNHAYSYGGPSLAINTVQNYFDVPIDFYLSVNMQGFQDIVDALGGVTIEPLMTFSQNGYDFYQGRPTRLDGEGALAYARMRKEDPEGDYGRQARQRQVIVASIGEVASLNTIWNYSGVLDTLEDNIETNADFDDMLSMFNNYRGATQDIQQHQLSGAGQMINGVYYEIIPDEERWEVSNQLKSELEIEPDDNPIQDTGSFDTSPGTYDTSGYDTSGGVYDTSGPTSDTSGGAYDTSGAAYDTSSNVYDTGGTYDTGDVYDSGTGY